MVGTGHRIAHLVLPTPGMFGVTVFADVLEQTARGYGITVLFQSEAVAVNPDTRAVTIADITADNTAGSTSTLGYDLMHVVPAQSAPDWVTKTPLADPTNTAGFIEVDRHTLRHVRYPDVFALGDAGSTLVANLLDAMAGRLPSASYNGYASCPLTLSRYTLLLAEFDYSMQAAPSIPLVDTTKEHRDMGYLKRYALPALYWHGMLRGLA